MGAELTRQVLDDPATAPIDERLRAALGLLRKVTLTPAAVTPDDVRAVLAAGATRAAVYEALHVGFLFNVYDRLADALGWDVPSQAAFDAGAARLLSRGYR